MLKDLGTVLVLFLLWRGFLFGANYVGRAMSPQRPTAARLMPDSPYWNGWAQQDSLHFANVIREGYTINSVGPWKGVSTNAAFFPLYPYAVKSLVKLRLSWGGARLFRTSAAAGLLVSNICLVFALYYMYRIARLSLGEDAAKRSLVYLLANPASFFFSAFYSESMFLLTTTGSIYYFLRGRHTACGVWGMLAMLTRSPGVVLIPALVVGHFWEKRFRFQKSDFKLL